MTQDEIIEMARQAGWSKEYLEFGDVRLERFAALVASAEREACAKVADHYSMHDQDTPADIAEAIRARGVKHG